MHRNLMFTQLCFSSAITLPFYPKGTPQACVFCAYVARWWSNTLQTIFVVCSGVLWCLVVFISEWNDCFDLHNQFITNSFPYLAFMVVSLLFVLLLLYKTEWFQDKYYKSVFLLPSTSYEHIRAFQKQHIKQIVCRKL